MDPASSSPADGASSQSSPNTPPTPSGNLSSRAVKIKPRQAEPNPNEFGSSPVDSGLEKTRRFFEKKAAELQQGNNSSPPLDTPLDTP